MTPLIVNDNALTFHQLQLEAVQGRYFSYSDHQWKSIGWVEWVVRKIFVFFFDSVQVTCMRHSFKSLEEMPVLPAEVENRIAGLFLDSFYATHPLSSLSGVICRLFCKVFRQITRLEGGQIKEIDIQQHPTERSFGLFYNGVLKYSAVNSEYGKIDFYNTQHQKNFMNDHDNVYNNQGERVGGIKLASDYPRLPFAMELTNSNDSYLAKVDDNKEKVSLLFRHTHSNSIMAVGNLIKRGSLINWKITIMEDMDIYRGNASFLVAWAALKYSQHHHFPSPQVLPYLTNPPQIQQFQAIL